MAEYQWCMKLVVDPTYHIAAVFYDTESSVGCMNMRVVVHCESWQSQTKTIVDGQIGRRTNEI
jgi:hypothetical protein